MTTQATEALLDLREVLVKVWRDECTCGLDKYLNCPRCTAGDKATKLIEEIALALQPPPAQGEIGELIKALEEAAAERGVPIMYSNRKLLGKAASTLRALASAEEGKECDCQCPEPESGTALISETCPIHNHPNEHRKNCIALLGHDPDDLPAHAPDVWWDW